MELVYNPNIDTLAIVTRDADFKPLLNKANEHGKETIIFGVEPGLYSAQEFRRLRYSSEKDRMSSYDESGGEGTGEKKIDAPEYQDSLCEESVEKT